VRGDMAWPPNKLRVSQVPYMIRHEEVGPATFQAMGNGLRAGFEADLARSGLSLSEISPSLIHSLPKGSHTVLPRELW
jgi:hypothetical protein